VVVENGVATVDRPQRTSIRVLPTAGCGSPANALRSGPDDAGTVPKDTRRAMTSDRLRQWARPVGAGACGLFLVHLLLSWQWTDVRVGGVVHVDHMTSGWSGWGALAGLCAMGLLVLVLAGRSRLCAAECPAGAITMQPEAI
jgi:hypothetical protein